MEAGWVLAHAAEALALVIVGIVVAFEAVIADEAAPDKGCEIFYTVVVVLK